MQKDSRNILQLHGTGWMLSRLSTSESFPAYVPGCVHMDLREAGRLPDIFYRDNEAGMQWIDEEDWEYTRSFTLSREVAEGEEAELVCEGLDTLAEVYLNDRLVLEAANMFRVWRAEVGQILRPGENTIRVRFKSPLPFMQACRERRKLREANIYFDKHEGGRGYLRKMACSFGWDWGPVAPTAGIWKPIRLEFVHGPTVADALILQHHAAGRCELEIQCELRGTATTLEAQIHIDGALIAETRQEAGDPVLRLRVENPQLWWPNTLGGQPLHTLTVTAISGEGIRDTWTRRIGLRSLNLVRERDEAGESFAFEVNGEAVFCKGANWVPHRIYLPDVQDAELRSLLRDAATANMNMLRVWGGGIYESDTFYDACDELGILVWQDFAFACGQYPSWDADFRAEIDREAADNIRRLRHHPSLALWCGNNELEMMSAGRPDYPWEEYTPPLR